MIWAHFAASRFAVAGRGFTSRLNTASPRQHLAADQVSVEIVRLLDGGEVRSLKEAKRLRFAERTLLLEGA
jgi:hypothetical protein